MNFQENTSRGFDVTKLARNLNSSLLDNWKIVELKGPTKSEPSWVYDKHGKKTFLSTEVYHLLLLDREKSVEGSMEFSAMKKYTDGIGKVTVERDFVDGVGLSLELRLDYPMTLKEGATPNRCLIKVKYPEPVNGNSSMRIVRHDYHSIPFIGVKIRDDFRRILPNEWFLGSMNIQ